MPEQRSPMKPPVLIRVVSRSPVCGWNMAPCIIRPHRNMLVTAGEQERAAAVALQQEMSAAGDQPAQGHGRHPRAERGHRLFLFFFLSHIDVSILV